MASDKIPACSRPRKRDGRTKHPLYQSWRNMFERCKYNKLYINKNIKVCERWRKDFWTFVHDMGPRPQDYTLERLENGSNYTPENTVWATKAEQNRNQDRNHRLTIDGVTKTIVEWSEEYKINPATISARIIRFGWSPRDAVMKSSRSRNPRYPRSRKRSRKPRAA